MDHLAGLVDLLDHLHCRLLAAHLPSRALRGLKISRQTTRKREPVTHLLLDLESQAGAGHCHGPSLTTSSVAGGLEIKNN